VINRPSPNRVAFGRLIRRYREAAGLTQVALSDQIHLSNSWISSVETGQLLPSPEQTEQLEQTLGIAEGTLSDVRQQAVNESHPVGSFEAFTALEAQASAIYIYEPLVVTGLLQTAEYARALVRGGRPTAKVDAVDDLVSTRLRRQEILSREDPPTLWIIFDEGALRRPAGGIEVHRAQLVALLQAAERPDVTVQIVPADTAIRPGLTSSFTIFRFNGVPDVGYSEDQLTGHPYESPESVKGLWQVWDALGMVTLPAAKSREVIMQILEENPSESR
jgi:transcriptional regulator with XRE-family HTH domain